jgi:hypothetical protein
LSVAHLEIQFRHDVLAETLDIVILNMAPITPQMGHNSAGARSFANSRSHEQIGFSILRFRHSGIARLPQRCDVIDVHSKA